MSYDMRWFLIVVGSFLAIYWSAIYGNVVLDNHVDRCWESGGIPILEPVANSSIGRWVCQK
jgi:hypothetical protein